MPQQARSTILTMLAAALVVSAATGAYAKAATKSEQRAEAIAFVNMAVSDATKDAKVGDKVQGYMDANALTPEILVDRKMPTPGNVQQYAAGGGKDWGDKSLSASGTSARAALQSAATMIEYARGEAEDKPQKFVAETGAKVVHLLGDTYNVSVIEAHKRINSIRAKLQKMVAIALVVNGGTSGGGAQTAEAKTAEAALKAREKALDAGEAALGQSIIALVGPEVPLARYGLALFEEARKETAEIPEVVEAKLDNLNEAEQLTGHLVEREGKARSGMKGKEGAESTDKALTATTAAVGNHMRMLMDAAVRMKAFEDGPGQAIKDVLACSLATYKAGEALTQDVPDSTQLALAQAALDSNIKAARGVGGLAAAWQAELAWLDQLASTEVLALKGFENAADFTDGTSKSGDATKIKRGLQRESSKIEKTPG